MGLPAALASEPAAEPAADVSRGALSGVVDLEQSRKELGLEEKWTHAEVELEREIAGWAADPRQGDASAPSAGHKTVTDPQGTFRLAGIAPGIYTVKIRGGSARPLIRRGIRVVAGKETTLGEPLVVVPASRLPLRLLPPRDPWNRPWKIVLLAEDLRSSRRLAEATADEEGFALVSELDEGGVRVEVRDADGRLWLEQTADVYPARSELFLSIDLVAVEGRLYHGDARLAGTLSFGTTQGATEIRMESGEDGRFSGYLPTEGRWEVEILWPEGDLGGAQRLRPVEVRRRPGKSFADLEIRIPQTELRGRVVFRGEMVPNAGVTVLREASVQGRTSGTKEDRSVAREAVVLTDEAGRFRLRGLEPGSFSLLAKKDGRSSGWTRLEVEEKSWPTDIQLELEELSRLSGRVGFGTQPVATALLLARSPGTAPHEREYFEAVTDADGLFELEMPSRVRELDLLIAAPAFGAEMFKVKRLEEGWEPLIVSLQTEDGSLRHPILPSAAGGELGAGLILGKNGATFRLSAVLRVLTRLGQLDWETGQILLRGMAPGAWRICREFDLQSCEAGELPANGDLTLAAPTEKGKRK